MSEKRSTCFGAAFLAVLLVACSSQQPEPASPPQAAKTEPSQPSTAAPATAETPATAQPVPPATQQAPPVSGAARQVEPAKPKETQPAAPPTAEPSQQKQVPAAPAAPEAQAKTPDTPAVPVPPEEARPIPTSQPPKAQPKDVVILKALLGGVRFEHKQHSETRKIPCETCHHASRPEKPATAPQQACGQCHTSVATPPMKTKLQAAFHNATATAGTCIDCHKAENAKGQAAPVKCLDCHKKENK